MSKGLDRRSFFARSTLALGGLLVGDAALEAFERLTHRKVFALGHPAPHVTFWVDAMQDRAMYGFGATVRHFDGRETVHRHLMARLAPEWRRAHPRLERQQLAYSLAKVGQKVSREHGIPTESMIPAMERAIA